MQTTFLLLYLSYKMFQGIYLLLNTSLVWQVLARRKESSLKILKLKSKPKAYAHNLFLLLSAIFQPIV